MYMYICIRNFIENLFFLFADNASFAISIFLILGDGFGHHGTHFPAVALNRGFLN